MGEALSRGNEILELNLEYLLTYLKYPEEIRWLIATTNPLEWLIKEVKRRSKVTEVFPAPDECDKVAYLITREINGKYSERVVAEFWLTKEGLLSIRREESKPFLRSYAWQAVHKTLNTLR